MSVPAEYAKKEIAIQVTQQESMRIEVYESTTDGLVVHRQVRWVPGKEEHKFTSKWQVTHEPSGLGLLTPTKCLPRQKDALKFAKRLKGVAEWSDMTSDKLSNDENLLATVKSIYDTVLREQEAEAAGEVVVDEEYKPAYTIARNREKGGFDVINSQTEEVVETFPHRGKAWKEAHRLNQKAT